VRWGGTPAGFSSIEPPRRPTEEPLSTPVSRQEALF
jgi:hypothetical protein